MNPTSRTFRVGDRVVTAYGNVGRIVSNLPLAMIDPYLVETGDDSKWYGAHELTLAVRMSQPARALLAAWHASDRTLQRIDRPNSSNRANINWGRAIRRYLSPDGSIDLTIAVEVK